MKEVPWTPLPFTKRLRATENIRRITGYHDDEPSGVNTMFPPDLLWGLERPLAPVRSGHLILTVGHERPAQVRAICLRAQTSSGLYVDTCDPGICGNGHLEMDIFGAIILCKYLSKVGNRGVSRDNEITLCTQWDSTGKPTMFSAEFVRRLDGARYTLGTFDFPR